MSERENSSSRQSVGALLEELAEFCRSESLSKDGLREIIGRHNCAPNNDDPNITNYEFFRQACHNKRVTEGIIRYLLEYFPNDAVRYAGERGRLPLHTICRNKNVTLPMVELLIDAFPDSVRHQDNKGRIPLHFLCSNVNLDEEIKLRILKSLLERCPESVRRTNRGGRLPLHAAATYQSPEFCRILIEAYPGSECIASDEGFLPFHAACQFNTVATTKYLYQLYPECINVAAHTIFGTILGLKNRKSNFEIAIEMVKFLLDCDPSAPLQMRQGKPALYWVCNRATKNTSKLNAYLKIVQILYDAHPEAIESNEVTSNVDNFCQEVQTFINIRLTYARQARDHHLMHSPDENGQLPLHKAFRDNATITLGSIKLLVKGNPSAITFADNSGMIPLHVACQYHDSNSIVEYLLDLDPTSIRATDFDDNTALHYACRGANHTIIALLLDKYGSMSVSKRNTHKLLPIDLLSASEAVRDKESVEYTESIYRLLRANPETIINSIST